MKRGWIGSLLLIVAVILIGLSLAAWKYSAIQASAALSAHQPEPMEVVKAVPTREIEHRHLGEKVNYLVLRHIGHLSTPSRVQFGLVSINPIAVARAYLPAPPLSSSARSRAASRSAKFC